MPLIKAMGNMYDWVTDMHTHIGGECPHKCVYCYVGKGRFGRAPRYTGKLRLIPEEFKVKYGSGRTIFIEHKNDMFASDVKDSMIEAILKHCREYDTNHYVFQSKNPERALQFYGLFPSHSMFGTTIETDRSMKDVSNAPTGFCRYSGIKALRSINLKTFITIEPILDFDDELAEWVIDAQPDFANIGADSKGCGLPEPSKEKILALIDALKKGGITIKEKSNLSRLLTSGGRP